MNTCVNVSSAHSTCQTSDSPRGTITSTESVSTGGSCPTAVPGTQGSSACFLEVSCLFNVMHTVMFGRLNIHRSSILLHLRVIWLRVAFIFVSMLVTSLGEVDSHALYLTQALHGQCGQTVVLGWCDVLLVDGDCGVNHLWLDRCSVDHRLDRLVY